MGSGTGRDQLCWHSRVLWCIHRVRSAGIADERVSGNPAADGAALQIQRVEAERLALARLYARGGITDDAGRRAGREFDLEDARVRHAAESATGHWMEADPASAGPG